ncbi:hypothetical protein [Oryzomicrobium sp.]|uniref:hypothetical protein n=1 Tax=Oryzomicrobium sp. TaxID=1911578 RepID=UPI0025D41594|nr:hypothetical protein [Oryzomicrobium sp.]MCE1242901.1 hypothetical protein [Oryzomicrobium sp.]
MKQGLLLRTGRKFHVRHGCMGLCLLILTACNALVGGVIGTADRIDDARESQRMSSISEESQARYKAMADRGDPRGLYYMAFVHAAKHMDDPGSDAYTVKQMYEEAVAKGSNDAKAMLGNMLVCGDTGSLWTGGCLGGLPKSARDPKRGLALLKEAAEKSCSFTEPLMAYGLCREREASIPNMIKLIYRDGDGGIPKNPEQEAYWRSREATCKPKIDEINRQRGCN